MNPVRQLYALAPVYTSTGVFTKNTTWLLDKNALCLFANAQVSLKSSSGPRFQSLSIPRGVLFINNLGLPFGVYVCKPQSLHHPSLVFCEKCASRCAMAPLLKQP